MQQLNDLKYDKILVALGGIGYTGPRGIKDMELLWLQSLIVSVPKPDQVNDAWYQYLIEQLVSVGSISDMQFEWLGSLGHTGSLSDRWHQYWATP